MKMFVRSAIISTISLLLLTWFVPEVRVINTVSLLITGVVLALLNAFLRPVLKLLFLPINIVTLGIFGWLINVIILYVAMWLVPGFDIGTLSLLGWSFNEFWSVVLVSIYLALSSSLVQMVL